MTVVNRKDGKILNVFFISTDFQTEMTDFELDLIEIERARERTRFSDASNEGDDDHLYVTKRPNRSVQFKDEDTILGGRTTPELSTDR